ncbi:MAG: M48 family metalloprotease [Candidatus Eremiobacteraeota bacterium]|nr:M48 family metalloprotease [Candidatus Eremiobacteraeota bacterium]MBV9737411.1 M48 family metalloprotease [Candidatus Eremiobacteraeota bacterium]
MIRRLIPIALTVALLSTAIPAPALALSTSGEIQLGKQADADIVQGNVVENDPLLNKWVASITDKLWTQVARKDVPYNIKILDDSSVNAFSTLGGYIYADEGLLDFVQSDDELAGVLGHETGHIERRHAVTLQAKAQGISLLFAIASLFSPLVYRFGQIAEAGLMAKLSRVDELQADQYGLLLMSRAGYDPEAMVTFMQHLGTLDKDRPDLISKYLEDHPEPDKRVQHLLGYPQLDPSKITTEDLLAAAVHDFDTTRYSIARFKFEKVLKTQPDNAQALLGLGQSELALGLVNKSEQTLAEAAQKGNTQTRATALNRIAALREMERRRTVLLQPNLGSLRTQLEEANSTLSRAATEVTSRSQAGSDQSKSMQNRLQGLSYEIPDFSRVEIHRGSRLETVVKDLETMARSVDSALDHTHTVLTNIGSLERNKEGGVLKDSADILHELQAPFAQSPMTADSIALLPSYPHMLSDINASSSDLIRAADASRAALAMTDVALGDLDAFLKQLNRVQLDVFGDINQVDYNLIVPLMKKANDSLNAAAVAASQSNQLYNMARSRQLQTRITMLGLGTSPQRYATLQKALDMRVGSTGIDYSSMLHQGLTPGAVAAAAIVAADTNATTGEVLQEAAASHRSIVDVANNRGMHAQALEIFLGLVYLDYTDDPQKELRG